MDENGPCTDSIFPFKTSIYNGLSIAMLNNQRVKQPLLNYCNPIVIHHGNPMVMVDVVEYSVI